MRTKKVFLAVAAMVTMLIAPPPVLGSTSNGAGLHVTTVDGKPVPAATMQYYEIKASQFGGAQPGEEAEPGEVGVQKKAAPLPEVPAAPEPAFIQQCQDPRNADKAGTAVGWTVNHYRWCQSVVMAWDYPRVNPTNRLLAKVTWVGYADPRARRFVIWGIIRKDFTIPFGSFPDDARLAAWAGISCDIGARCTQDQQPSIGATLAELRQQDRQFRVELTSDPAGLTTPDLRVKANVYSVFSAKGGSAGPSRDAHLTNEVVESRCDSTTPRLRTAQACIFNNVWPVLTYDKADIAFPVGQLIDHIRYAQDFEGAPGKFANGTVVGAPLHRVRNATTIRANRARPRQTCRLAKPVWNGRVEQCDEYPFASTREGAGSGGPYSARLINARQNQEGGIQLANWYAWDRILEGDQFWVQTLG